MKRTSVNRFTTQTAGSTIGTPRRTSLALYGLAAALALTISTAHVQAQTSPSTQPTAGTQGPAMQPHAMPGQSMQHRMQGHSAHGPQAGSGTGAHGHARGDMHAQGHGHRMGEGGAGGFGRMLHSLGLDEVQRDRIFSIRHAAAPALREKAKAVRTARQELATVAMASEYDSARAKAAAEQLARATADMAELRAQTHHQVFRVLTPEQQKQLQERRGRMQPVGAAHGHRHGPHHG